MDKKALPTSILEIAEVIGLKAALAIVEARGGITLYVPVRARADHWLADLIGLEALESLVQVYGGEEIPIPRCASALRRRRDKEILARWRAGESQPKLARAYGLTEPYIRAILRRAEEEERHESVQPSLL